ncbi:MAG: bifunctional phosphopantothenoylcysteine decarboxylase/phosphopantothenate synthase [Gemmataceae bacterium]|nr:bifunctional phosphopantothenoylcysteine decarboxylase/phosphopantothenate synthase [Gemmataceae bacterium]
MNILVTAGNTQAPIDRVRCITNVFTGRTGGRIAATAAARGHAVTLLTSHPEAVPPAPADRLTVRPYQTFADLDGLMAEAIPGGRFDALLHAAAVGDYHVAGTFARHGDDLVDVSAGKVKSDHPELWLKLVRAPKLVDKVRSEWGFRGVLVKFKLEVGVTDAELLPVAERSRVQSGADLMCANTLDGMADWAFVGAADAYQKVARDRLADHLLAAVEALAAGRGR